MSEQRHIFKVHFKGVTALPVASNDWSIYVIARDFGAATAVYKDERLQHWDHMPTSIEYIGKAYGDERE